jgi:O-methyltransferase
MQKVAGLINILLSSSLGIRITSARPGELDKNFINKILYFQRLFDLLKGREGDVVECGVASGISLAILASLVRSSGINRHIWGFDCWSRSLAPGEKDLAYGESLERKLRRKQIAKVIEGKFGAASLEKVLANLRFHGFSDSEISNRVTLVKGLFSKTLPEYGGKQIALLNIDADLYDSYMDVLQNLWPKVAVGGIVTFDEYNKTEEWPGARQAVDDFLGSLPAVSAKLEKDKSFDRYYAIKLA